MRLLVIRGDLQSHAGYSAAARDYCRLLQGFFDRGIGVDIHYSSDRPYEKFPHPLVADAEARRLAAAANAALVVPLTTPNSSESYPNAATAALAFRHTS